MSTEPIARYFDGEAACACERGADPRFASVTRALLDDLDRHRVRGRTVLDVGSGSGKLAVEIARRGAARVDGIDLSPQSARLARGRADDAGVSRRTSFTVGNAATDGLQPHDVTVLDKVLCCYFDADAILANVLPATGSVLVLSVPESRGLLGLMSRIGVGAENVWRALRGSDFRAHVHDVRRIDAGIRAAGFVRRRRRHRFVWYLAAYEREPSAG